MSKKIMIQGTMSGVGKSILTAGLCRILKENGIKAAPFKSQNMALNSYITKQGLEMGRAQVTQAEAAGIEPLVQMNPILLKPTNDTGSQVIVNGELISNMSAREYFARKKDFIPDILKAFEYLSERYEAIVIEGAGSPAEINLRENDIVNMGLAELVDSPVILAGDIDRGGVFAQLVGTVELLSENERKRVKGFIINKFRGDVTLLRSGLDFLEKKTGIPVLGVVPYMKLELPDEDSLSERFEFKGRIKDVDIAVIRLPRISNFSDFDIFENIDELSLRYVSSVDELNEPDMIILPGSKNTIEDLIWLRESGLEAMIKRFAAKGRIVFGICGGYQMLGNRISDPEGMESSVKEIRGLELLPLETVLKDSKVRRQTRGKFPELEGVLGSLSGMDFEGYEIHIGESTYPSCNVGNVYGSYVHGIFDAEGIAAAIVEAVLKKKGKAGGIHIKSEREIREDSYIKLAENLRENLDMEKIAEIMECSNY